MNFKKMISLLLVLVMAFGLVACGSSDKKPSGGSSSDATGSAAGYADPYAEFADDYDALSEALYQDTLGEFAEALEAATATSTNAERFALMAVAEAKLLESGVLIPSTNNGGNYAISRLAPNTVTTVMWGGDPDRFHNALVTTEPITVEHRDQMKALWNELKGTGTWEAEARKFLEDNGYTLKDSYNSAYVADPTIWDILGTSRATDTQPIVNTYDGLVEYNTENVLSPALAESWEKSEDGLTYTFKLREGVKWADSQGREIAEITADDFVAGMQHMMDCKAGLEFLIDGVIVNAKEYINGDVTDFSQVGVKAVDKYTVEYTLTQPTPYFMTMISYSVFAPMNRQFFESKGGKFGADFDNSDSSYIYGKTSDDIAYCGPYLVSNATKENTIVFVQNPLYWNKDGINIKSMTWLFDSGKDPTALYKNTINGTIDGAGLNASAVESSKKDGNFDKFVYATDTHSSSFPIFVNINRAAFANAADGAAATAKSEEECIRATAALRNVHFRRAFAMSIDRASYNAQVLGESLKYNSLANGYVPGTFVTLDEDVTISINGTDTAFPAGTYFGEIVQAQIDADGVNVKVWDSEKQTSNGFDGWYNPENAAAEMEIAVAELAEQGVVIDAEHPITLDYPTLASSDNYRNRSNALKQSVEASLGGSVLVSIVDCNTQDDWSNAGYMTSDGSEANYDIYDNSGWTPDYGDPDSYLNAMLSEYAGFMTKCIGIY